MGVDREDAASGLGEPRFRVAEEACRHALGIAAASAGVCDRPAPGGGGHGVPFGQRLFTVSMTCCQEGRRFS